MKVLITGVAGFIGSNLLDYLIDNTDWKIVGVDNLSTGTTDNIQHQINNSRFEFQQKNVSEISTMLPFTYVFHLAALPRIQPSFELISEHVNANLSEGIHLIELMIKESHFPRLIYSGSSAIYGTPTQIPTPETERIDCLSPYAFQKYEFEKYLEFAATRYPVDYVTLRYFNPFGDRSFNPKNQFNAYSSVVGIFLNKKFEGKTLQITGDGSQLRDFIHVLDIAKANYLAAIHEIKLNTFFNVGKGDTLSVLDLAKMIDNANYGFIDKREGESEITFADVSKAKKVLGWEPTLTLQDYIKDKVYNAGE